MERLRRYVVSFRMIPLLLTLLALVLLGTFGKPFLFGLSAPSADAKQGVLDLKNWDWNAEPKLKLNGEWEFYWNQLLSPQDLHNVAGDGEAPSPIAVLPASWNGTLVDGLPISGKGYATYRLRILLPSDHQELALRIPVISTAYRLWINGQPVAAAGQVGTSVESTIPSNITKLANAEPFHDELELVLQIANFHHQKGGLRQPIELGQFGDIVRTKELSVAFDALLVGSLLIMGLYHLGLFAVRTKEWSSLYFGIFCILFSLRMVLLSELLITKLFPDFSWVIALRLEYITAALLMIVFILFFSSLFPSESLYKINMAFGGAALLYSAMAAVMDTIRLSERLWILQVLVCLGIIYILWVSVRSFFHRREGAGILLMSCVIISATIINDMLYAHDLVQTSDRMSAFGLLVFIFFQSMLLSMKLSRAFLSEERLSAELVELNNGLHEKIKERTSDLEHANEALRLTNEELSRLAKSRSHLISNISHDLGTPLTTIQGYLEAILDGMVDEEHQKERYLRLIHGKVLSMDRLIGDLFQLAQLEARQVAFIRESIQTDQLMDTLFRRYELDAKNAGLEYTLTCRLESPQGGRFSMVAVDLERMHQVFGNLIYNAIKFTPEGGMIHLEMTDNHEVMLCRIIDTGDGINPADLPYVFDRFYTSNKSRNRSAGGKGLGLSISKEIIEYHEGRIWIERTAAQQGTVFCIQLPVEKSLTE